MFIFFSRVNKLASMLVAMTLCVPIVLLGQIGSQFEWKEFPALPEGHAIAGAFSGVIDESLIVMGGVVSPSDKSKATNRWSSRIYSLENSGAKWELATASLPIPLAFGISVTHRNHMVIAGGRNEAGIQRAVYRVRATKSGFVVDSLATMPVSLVGITGALMGDILFVSGAQVSGTDSTLADRNYFMALNLGGEARDESWQVLPPMPGGTVTGATGAALGGKFYLFGGLDADANEAVRHAYHFDPKFSGSKLIGGVWKSLAELPVGMFGCSGPAPTAGSDHILLLGGKQTTSIEGSDEHGSFAKDAYVYHVASDSWLTFGELPRGEERAFASVTRWQGDWVLVGGELDDSMGSQAISGLTKRVTFGWVNWMTLIVYLLFMVWIGYRFHHGEQTTTNFFTVSGKIPWWAAGISLFGAQISAITYMATPAIVYATDWSLALGSLMILVTVPFVIKFYIPFFRRLSVTSAYEYLEHRFSRTVRVIGSISFILFQLGRIGIVLFLPAIAISSVTHIDVYLIIVVMGVICVFYAVLGGMEAVIWTDVVQVTVLIGGAVLCLIVATSSVDGGLMGVLDKGIEAGKFTLFHLNWDYTQPVLWVIIVGFFFLDIIPYTSDQTIVQRYLIVKDEKAAAKSLWTNAFIVLPSIVVFFGIGTVLFVFYSHNPMAVPAEKVGEILPYFIVQELPVGIAGLVIAGIFAASQSALGASMNSVSAAYVTDIHPLFRRVRSDSENLSTARVATIGVGLIGMLSAMLVAWLNVDFLFVLFMEVLGIMGGTLAGVFILGIFTQRATAIGAVFGVIFGVLAVWLAKSYTDVNSYLYGAISVLSTIVMGYLASLFTAKKTNLENLTYFTKNDRFDSGE